LHLGSPKAGEGWLRLRWGRLGLLFLIIIFAGLIIFV